MSIEDRLFTVGFKPDEHESHLKVIDPAVCVEKCGAKNRPCTTFCPASVYNWEENRITVAYNNCLECLTCRTGCPFRNIECNYPRGSHGITYKYG